MPPKVNCSVFTNLGFEVSLQTITTKKMRINYTPKQLYTLSESPLTSSFLRALLSSATDSEQLRHVARKTNLGGFKQNEVDVTRQPAQDMPIQNRQ